MKDKMKKQLVKHLKEDKRTFKREAADDEELIKRLQKSSKMPAKPRVKSAAKAKRDNKRKK